MSVLLYGLIACTEPAEKQQPVEENITNSDFVTLTAQQITNGGIETAVPVSQKLNTELTVNGSIDVPPQNIVSVSFPFGGYLKNTRLLPGMHVSRGEVIGVMEDQSLVQIQQDYLMAVARLKFLNLEYERQKTLRESNVNSAKIFQQVESEYSSQKVLVSGLAQKLRMINVNPATLTESKISGSVSIYSPINGFVSRVNVNIGKFVNPTDVLFELINPDDMHAALVVFEKDIAKVRKGQKVMVSLVDEPERKYLCEVILVTRNLNENRTGIVHCHFEEIPKTLLPGMFLNGTILLSDIEALTVPEESVVRYGSKEFVLQAEGNNQFRLQPVTTGIRSDGRVQIIDSTGNISLKPIITKNAYAVLSKIKNKSD
ncbi:MAG: efflux RND transporter periplasmic adaptor subunit [Chitinophagaceae bacterium]|nr:MAG: efflux RND transporter periplasmic adaptor subunit [Chitinophagaceae bacterium]